MGRIPQGWALYRSVEGRSSPRGAGEVPARFTLLRRKRSDGAAARHLVASREKRS